MSAELNMKKRRIKLEKGHYLFLTYETEFVLYEYLAVLENFVLPMG